MIVGTAVSIIIIICSLCVSFAFCSRRELNDLFVPTPLILPEAVQNYPTPHFFTLPEKLYSARFPTGWSGFHDFLGEACPRAPCVSVHAAISTWHLNIQISSPQNQEAALQRLRLLGVSCAVSVPLNASDDQRRPDALAPMRLLETLSPGESCGWDCLDNTCGALTLLSRL